MGLKFGLRFSSLGRWGKGPAAIELAQAAEEAGFESIWTVEHVVVPKTYQSRYPYSADGRMGMVEDFPIPDPIVWLSFVVGGDTQAAARRAGRIGDGYLPARGNPVELYAEMRAAALAAGRDPDRIEISAAAPSAQADIDELVKAGVGRVMVPVAGAGGLPPLVKNPDEVLRYGREVIARYQ